MIRHEEAKDAGVIRRVNTAAFRTPAEARLVDALRQSGRPWISLVAESDQEIVGHIAWSPVTLDPATDGIQGIGLAPVAVLPGKQRTGVGSQLVEAGLKACKQAGHAFAVVLGDPDFYSRFGFIPATDHGLSNEYGAGNEFMVRPFRPDGVPVDGGLIRYAPEFAAL